MFFFLFKLRAWSFYAYLCWSIGPSLEKMLEIVKVQEFALQQKTKVIHHVELTTKMPLHLLCVSRYVF